MTSKQANEVLTDANVALAGQVLQAVDTLIEADYVAKHQAEVRKQLPMSESEISEIADRQIREFPPMAGLLNGNGYHLLSSHTANCLKSIGREKESEMLLAARIESE